MRLNRLSALIMVATWIAVLALGHFPARADDASQFLAPPPAVYKSTLAKLLTPADAVLKKEAEYSQLQGEGIAILDETITYVDADGKRITVYHTINKALNDAGAKDLAQDTFTYKKNFQRAYLVSAQSIQPDGTRDAVKADAIFLKSPQDEADDSVYNDESEMVTVYSNIKPGSMTESIIVLEDFAPRIPDQFSQTYTWNNSWPEYLQRLVIDLPKSYADRLKITNLGSSVPSPTTLETTPGRQRLGWEKLNTPAEDSSDTKAPSLQIGPLVWLTTLDSWDTFAHWYNGLLKGTDQLSPALKAKIDVWTKDAKDPADIVRILYGHVARDVRYTAFELGKSDLQPHNCTSVWDQQYGDCKDKANLLRAMLAYKGVTSCLVLLTTEHAGVVNKDSPDYRQFNHCIDQVVVGKDTIFCDPTITYGAPGILSGSDSDRDVLLIKGDKAEWAHTPAFHDSAVTYTFDLQLRPSGELAGWMRIQATGYYSAYYRDTYSELTKQQTLSDLQDTARSFFPNSTVADVDPLKKLPSDASQADLADFSIRAYMVLTGVLNQGDAPSSLNFPAPGLMLPDTADYKTREHATYTWPDTQVTSCQIHLPPGWNAGTLPVPLNYDSPGANYQAAWTVDKDTLTAHCIVTLKKSLFPADDMRTLGDALTNLLSWTGKPLTLTKSNDPTVAASPAQTDAELGTNLPVMPTGEGQLNLIDSEFPDDGNVAARRAALERIPTLFPSDPKSIVEASIQIAIIDLDNEKWPEVIARLQPIVEANRAALDPDTIAWADYIRASALKGQGKKEEARVIYQKMAEDNAVGSGRRGWAIYMVASLLSDKSPASALDYADKGLDLDSEADASLYGLYATIAISNGQADRLKARLTKLIAAKPENLEDILLETSNSAKTLIEGSHKKEGLDLVALLESVSDPATTGDAFARALKKVRDGAEATAVSAKVQDDLKQALTQFPEIAALEKKQPKFSSNSDAEKSATQHEQNSEPDEALGCYLRLAIGSPADDQFPGYFWNCVRYTEWGMRTSATPPKELFFFKLAELGDEFPHTSDTYVDTKLLLAKVFEKKEKRTDAGNIYAALMKQTDLPDGFQGPLALRSGTNWEEQGDYAKALDCYHFGEAFVDAQDKAQEAVLRAAFIQFDNGNKTEALRLVGVLADAVQKSKNKPGEQVRDVVAVGKDAPPAMWENWHAWWPQWQQIETDAGLDPVKDRKIIPIIPSMTDLGETLGTAKNGKDTKGFFESMRQLAYAARFYPNAALEFVGVFTTAEEVLPDHANDFRLLAVSILEPLTVTEAKDQRMRVLDLMVNYVDSNQVDKALDLMSRGWTPELDDESKVSRAVHRVWGLAALQKKQDLDKVRTALEKDMKAEPGANSGSTAGILADVYIALGLQQDAKTLLEAELAIPAVASDSSVQQELKTRLDNLQNASDASRQLADGVTAWLKDQKPAWWDYAEPKSADDPRLARLDDIIKNSTGELLPAEQVKAGLLAPTVSSLPSETQERAVIFAFTALLGSCHSQDDADALAKSILENPTLPKSVKAGFLYFFLLDASSNQQVASFQAFAQNPLYQAMPAREIDIMDRIGGFMKVDRTSSSALKANVATLTGHPMDSLGLGIVQDTVTALLQLGDIDSAQAIYQGASGYTFGPNSQRTKPEFQLTLLREINQARRLKPTIDAFRQATLAARKPETISKPTLFDRHRHMTGFDDLTEKDATDFRLYLIKTHQEPFTLSFWYDFMRDQSLDADAYALNLSLLKAGLDSSPDDDLKATLVDFGAGVLDTDNAELRQKYLDLLQPYRDPVKFPQTAENIRMIDATLAVRLGKSGELDSGLSGFTTPFNARQAERLKLRAYLQAKNLPRLKDTLNGMSADELMSPLLVESVLPALDAAGMKDEASLARDTLSRKLYQDVLTAWFSSEGKDLQSVVGDVDGLDSTKDLPEAFTTFAQGRITRQRPVLSYQLCKAYTDKDWNTASSVGTVFAHDYPTYYTTYWYLGRSLAELGKKDEAIQALTTYCQYSRDEVWYPDAKDLLAKLTSGAPSPVIIGAH